MEIPENWMPYAFAALIGAGGGTGGTLLSHSHPEIIDEIREVEYESEIFKLSVQISAMEETGQDSGAAYAVSVAQLIKFEAMLTELDE